MKRPTSFKTYITPAAKILCLTSIAKYKTEPSPFDTINLLMSPNLHLTSRKIEKMIALTQDNATNRKIS